MAYTSIDNPAEYFDIKLWSGTGSEQAISSLEHEPNLVWIKRRDATNNHRLTDSVRGVTKEIYSDLTDAEDTQAQGLKSFDSTGFTLGTNAGYNASGGTYVGWCWKESTTAGFDIVSYAGNGVEGRNISHSLGAKPHWMVVKNRSSSVKWAVYHEKNTSAPGTDHLQLNSDAATSDDDSTWDDTEPTSSVFRVKSSTSTNGSSANYIAYLWTPIKGFSKFSSYVGNGSNSGTMIFTGFKPAWVLIKLSSGSGNSWNIFDNKREGYNPDNDALFADVNGTETTTDHLDILSNGFKIRNNSSAVNTSGATYVYMAFAESPFTNSNGVPTNAR